MSQCRGGSLPHKNTNKNSFVDRLSQGKDDTKGLLEAILGRTVQTKELQPPNYISPLGNWSQTKSVRFSFNVEDHDSQIHKDYQVAVDGKPLKSSLLSKSKLSSRNNQLSDKGSEIEGFGKEALKTKFRNLIENEPDDEQIKNLNNKRLRNVQFKPYVDENGNISIKIIEKNQKTFLRSLTENKAKAAEELFKQPDSFNNLKTVPKGKPMRRRRYSDQLKLSKLPLQPSSYGLEAFLDKHAFSDNDSDNERLTPIFMLKKKEQSKPIKHSFKHQNSIASKVNTTSEVSTNCGNPKTGCSEVKIEKDSILIGTSVPEKNPPSQDNPYYFPDPLTKAKIENSFQKQNFTILEEPSYAEDAFSPSVLRRVEEKPDDASVEARKDQIKPCLKKNGKYSLFEKIVKAAEDKQRGIISDESKELERPLVRLEPPVIRSQLDSILSEETRDKERLLLSNKSSSYNKKPLDVALDPQKDENLASFSGAELSVTSSKSTKPIETKHQVNQVNKSRCCNLI